MTSLQTMQSNLEFDSETYQMNCDRINEIDSMDKQMLNPHIIKEEGLMQRNNSILRRAIEEEAVAILQNSEFLLQENKFETQKLLAHDLSDEAFISQYVLNENADTKQFLDACKHLTERNELPFTFESVINQGGREGLLSLHGVGKAKVIMPIHDLYEHLPVIARMLEASIKQVEISPNRSKILLDIQYGNNTDSY